MIFYTLDASFQRDQIIDLFDSAIWTERFVEAGEFQLKLPVSKERIAALDQGRFLELEGSNETMIIESQSLEDGVLTITGRSIETFFNERYTLIPTNFPNDTWKFVDYPGVILQKMVNEAVILTSAYANGSISGGTHVMNAPGGTKDQIPFLDVAAGDITGSIVTEVVPFGLLYDALLALAKKYTVGMTVSLTRPDAFSYSLRFKTFTGTDRTRDQLDVNPIIFSQALDNVANVKEVSSNVGAKTVAYVLAGSYSQTVYAPGHDDTERGFDRRVLVINAEQTWDSSTQFSDIPGLVYQQGVDALANNNFTKLIDGEVIPQPGYVYGQNFFLGDKIELIGQSGIPQKALITEFIRSQDDTGERAYPTVSVVD